MADQAFEVIFKTTADLAGAQATKAAMADVQGSVESAGAGGEAANEGLGKSFQDTRQKVQGLKTAAEAMTNLLEGNFAGAAINAASGMKALNTTLLANPWFLAAAAVTVLTVALYKMTQVEKEAQAETTKMREQTANANAEFAKTSVLSNYELAVGAISRRTKDFTADLGREKAALDAAKQAMDEMAAAKLAMEDAKVDLDVAGGKMTESEGQRRKIAARGESERAGIEREQQQTLAALEQARKMRDYAEKTIADNNRAARELERGGEVTGVSTVKETLEIARENSALNKIYLEQLDLVEQLEKKSNAQKGIAPAKAEASRMREAADTARVRAQESAKTAEAQRDAQAEADRAVKEQERVAKEAERNAERDEARRKSERAGGRAGLSAISDAKRDVGSPETARKLDAAAETLRDGAQSGELSSAADALASAAKSYSNTQSKGYQAIMAAVAEIRAAQQRQEAEIARLSSEQH